MPSYSSDEFHSNWRYAVEKEFITANGQPFVYAENGKQQWGDELKTIKFDSSPECAAINDGRTLLAVGVDNDIHLFNAEFEPESVLRAHTSEVDAFAFQPGQPHTLASCAMTEGEPIIIFWNVKDQDSKKPSISGRLAASFQSNIFSPSGKFLMYMPGRRPPSNEDNQWDINIRSLPEHEDIFTLSGHRDAIMWTGFDGSEKLIGTASWDRTFRIWDAQTGQERYSFRTCKQNWTAGFSPDSKLFAGTSGDGVVHVYSLDDGSELFQLDFDSRWCRALDWTPDSKMLAVGGRLLGSMILIDVSKKEIVQKRALSTAKATLIDKTARVLLDSFLEVNRVKFVDQGRKLVFWTYGDCSAEAYDLATGTKWRFAREGTESYEDGKGSDTMKTAAGKGGRGMKVWEESAKGRIMVATFDYDAVRIWSLKMHSSDIVSAGAC